MPSYRLRLDACNACEFLTAAEPSEILPAVRNLEERHLRCCADLPLWVACEAGWRYVCGVPTDLRDGHLLMLLAAAWESVEALVDVVPLPDHEVPRC
jgi:hypothetical protein